MIKEKVEQAIQSELGEDDGREVVIGNPTEGALLQFLKSSGVDYLKLRERYRIESQQPFSTAHSKYRKKRSAS